MNTLAYPASPVNADEEIIKPSDSFKKSAVSVTLSMVMFVFAYLFILAAALGLVFLMAFAGIALVSTISNIWVVLISLSLVLSSVMLLYFLLKFMFKKQEHDYSNMLEITEEEQPRLFRFLRELTAETKAPFPNKIYLSADVNASVFYDASFWNLFFPAKKNLNIGLGLVNALNLSEFKAVMAHEFGHFSQRSMKLGVYSYNMHRVIYNLVYENEQYEDTMKMVGNWHWVLRLGISFNLFLVRNIQKALVQVYNVVDKRYMQLSREMEFNADAVAAFVAGSDNTINSLRRIQLASFCLDELFGYFNTLAKEKKRPANIYSYHLKTMRFFAHDQQLTLDELGLPVLNAKVAAFNNTRVNIEDQWASHPRLNDREEKLKQIGLQCQTTNVPAWEIFDNYAQLQVYLTNIIYANHSEQPYTVDDEIITAAYIAHNNEQSLNTFYKNYYNGRYITKFDIQQSIERPWAETSIDELFKSENCNLPLSIIGLDTDINSLTYIADTDVIKSFDFDGIKYTKNQADAIKSRLLEEKEQLETQLKWLDEEIFRYFYHNSVDPPSIIAEYEAYFFQQEKTERQLNFYLEITKAINPIYNTLPFSEIERVLDDVYKLEESLKSQIEEIVADEQYASVMTDEHRKYFKTYLSKQWVYFTHSEYDEPAILVLNQALGAFYEFVINKLFACKKILTDKQLSLLKLRALTALNFNPFSWVPSHPLFVLPISQWLLLVSYWLLFYLCRF